MTDTIYRYMMTDGSMPDDVVIGVQVQNMTDEAALVGKKLTNFTVVFNGTMNEARAKPDFAQYVPDFVPEKDLDKLRILVHSADVVAGS